MPRDLLARCVRALDDDPDAMLAHAWTAVIDSSGNVVGAPGPGVALDALRPADRFRSMLYEGCQDYEYAVIRTQALRRVKPQASYHLADRMFTTELALHGRFLQVQDWLYFRREHPRGVPRKVRERCATLDPRRANRLRHPVVRLYGEYLWAYSVAIRGAPLSTAERYECFGILTRYLASRVVPVMGESLNGVRFQDPLSEAPFIPVDLIVAGRGEGSVRAFPGARS